MPGINNILDEIFLPEVVSIIAKYHYIPSKLAHFQFHDEIRHELKMIIRCCMNTRIKNKYNSPRIRFIPSTIQIISNMDVWQHRPRTKPITTQYQDCIGLTDMIDDIDFYPQEMLLIIKSYQMSDISNRLLYIFRYLKLYCDICETHKNIIQFTTSLKYDADTCNSCETIRKKNKSGYSQMRLNNVW